MAPTLARRLLTGWLVLTIVLWLGLVYFAHGLFDWVGYDFGLFWGAGRAFLFNGPGAAYDMGALGAQLQPLAGYYVPGDHLLKIAPVPYPPVFFLVVLPFALMPPLLGFLLWTLANLGCSLYVLHRIVGGQRRSSWLLIGAFLSFLPLALSFFVGQPMGLLLLLFYQGYRNIERGEEFRAGVWFALLLIKPQYACCLLFVLVLRRRWRALAGAATGGIALAVLSLVLLRASGLRALLALMHTVTSFNTSDIALNIMISWRGLLATLVSPSAGREALLLTIALSLLTLGALLFIWRGSGELRGARLPERMLATMIVTMLVGYHTHVHGAVLLVVPAAALLTAPNASRPLRVPLLLGLLLPTALYFLTLDMEPVAILGIALMVFALAVILLTEMTASNAPSAVHQATPIISDRVADGIPATS